MKHSRLFVVCFVLKKYRYIVLVGSESLQNPRFSGNKKVVKKILSYIETVILFMNGIKPQYHGAHDFRGVRPGMPAGMPVKRTDLILNSRYIILIWSLVNRVFEINNVVKYNL